MLTLKASSGIVPIEFWKCRSMDRYSLPNWFVPGATIMLPQLLATPEDAQRRCTAAVTLAPTFQFFERTNEHLQSWSFRLRKLNWMLGSHWSTQFGILKNRQKCTLIFKKLFWFLSILNELDILPTVFSLLCTLSKNDTNKVENNILSYHLKYKKLRNNWIEIKTNLLINCTF